MTIFMILVKASRKIEAILYYLAYTSQGSLLSLQVSAQKTITYMFKEGVTGWIKTNLPTSLVVSM